MMLINVANQVYIRQQVDGHKSLSDRLAEAESERDFYKRELKLLNAITRRVAKSRVAPFTVGRTRMHKSRV